LVSKALILLYQPLEPFSSLLFQCHSTIVDSQSVKTTEIAHAIGFDGAKLIKGHKRHVLVDTLRLLLQVVVSAANMSEKAGALLILEKIVGQFPRLLKIFADGGYEGKDFRQKVKDDHHLELEVVKRKQSKGFQVLPCCCIAHATRVRGFPPLSELA